MAKPGSSRSFSVSGLSPLQVLRHLVQLAVALALHGKAFGLQSTAVVVPFLHPSQAPFSTAAGAFEALEYTIARGVFPLLVLGVFYFCAVAVGRVFCGWACPFGLVQDVLSYLPLRHEKLSPETVASLKDVKRGVLAFSLLFAVLVGYRRAANPSDVPLGVFSDAPYSVVDPSSALFAYVPWLVMWKAPLLSAAGLFGWVKLVLLVAALVPSAYVPRFFCRYVCPISAMHEPVASVRLLRITRPHGADVRADNAVLADVCPMGVQLAEGAAAGDMASPDCVHCGKCIEQAPGSFSQAFL